LNKGDIVSRDGSDEQEVIGIDNDWGQITVKCIKEPKSGWCKLGDVETNLARRYTLIRKRFFSDNITEGEFREISDFNRKDYGI
jgi:hypothetical protein